MDTLAINYTATHGTSYGRLFNIQGNGTPHRVKVNLTAKQAYLTVHNTSQLNV